MSLKLMAAVAVMIAGALPAYATGATNLVTNGDFESTTYGAGGSGGIATPLGGGSSITQNVTGWTMGYRSGSTTVPGLGIVYASGQGDNTGVNPYLYGPQNGHANGLTANSGSTTTGGYGNQAGGNYVALDADPSVDGTLSQSIGGLTVGAGYMLTFEWATAELQANNVQVQTTEYLQATLGSQTQSTATLTTAAAGFDPWRQVTMYFTATSTSEVLGFLAIGGPAGDPPTVLLDAVSLTYAPEPSTWAIMLVGVGGVAGFTAMRRRSRVGATAA